MTDKHLSAEPTARTPAGSQDYFIADTHFGHKNVIEFCARPFIDTQAMDAVMIEAWNDTVKNQDRVFVLGDFSFYDAEKTEKILAQLHGQKFLVKGNHDSSKMLKRLTKFAKVSAYEDLKLALPNGETVRAVLSHFPFLSWHQMHRGAYHFHGHCHGGLRLPKELEQARIFDVGVDNLSKVFGSYAPVSLENLVQHLVSRKLTSVDGHKL